MLTNTHTKAFHIFKRKQHEQNNAQEILIIVITLFSIYIIYFIILTSLQDRITKERVERKLNSSADGQ